MVRKIGAKRRRKAAPKRRTTHRRRRRISGLSGSDLSGIAMKVLGVGTGAIAARELNTIAVKQFPGLSPLLSGVGQVVAGIVLPMVVKNNKFVADMGDGMAANGVMVIAVSTGVISGANNTVSYRISGGRPRGMGALSSSAAVAGLNPGGMVAGLNSGMSVAGRRKYRPMQGRE